MKKITEKEENEMYQIINDALLSICQDKPNNPVEFLSKKMLQLIGEETDDVYRSKKIVKSKGVFDEVIVNIDKIALQSLTKKFSDHYKVLNLLGVGSHGEVYLVEDINSHDQKRVVKMVKKTEQNPHSLSQSTIEILLSLDHPNIVKIYDVMEDEEQIYIVQEHCVGGDLFSFVVNSNFLSEALVKNIVKQILDAIKYLNSKNIVHRDIKPENILIVNKSISDVNEIIIKLNDFGSSEFLGKKKRAGGKVVGSPFYIAPEVIEGKFDYKCDLWSVGVLTYTMLCGKPPFTGKQYEVLYNILNNDFEFTPYHSDLARDFISALTLKTPKKRPEIDVILRHDWLLAEESNEDKNDSLGVEILGKMSKFVLGKNLRRSVLSYILSRKIYVDNNNELLKLFKEIDKNGNGQIEVTELYDSYGKFFPGTPEEGWDKVKMLIDRVDINKNGSLEYSEFLAVTSLVNKEFNQKMLKEVFLFYDKDDNGYIQAADLKEIFEDSDLTDENFQNMIDDFDQDGDRKISFNEFFTMITNAY